MRIKEGPAFGALIIGGGFAYFLYERTGRLGLAALTGLAIGLLDYAFLLWIANRTRKK